VGFAPPVFAEPISSYDSWCWNGFTRSGPPSSSLSTSSPLPLTYSALSGSGLSDAVGTASLSGYVYLDADYDGIMDASDWAIADAEISLTYDGSTDPIIAYSNKDGLYSFSFTPPTSTVPVKYSIAMLTPSELPGQVTLGQLSDGNGISVDPGQFDNANDKFYDIGVLDGYVGVDYNFAEAAYPFSLVSKRMLINGGINHTVPEPGTLVLLVIAGLISGSLAWRSAWRQSPISRAKSREAAVFVNNLVRVALVRAVHTNLSRGIVASMFCAILALFLFAGLASATLIEPIVWGPSSTAVTIADVNEAGGLLVGDKLFAGFTVVSSGNASFLPTEETIKLVGFQSTDGDYGVKFSDNWTVFSGQSLDTLINFDVSVSPQSSGYLIKDNLLALTAVSATSTGSYVLISENVYSAAPPQMNSISDLLVYKTWAAEKRLDSQEFSDPNELPVAYSKVWVTKDIALYGGTDAPGVPGAHLSEFVQTFSQVPEPSTLALLGVGVIGLLAYAWRHRRS